MLELKLKRLEIMQLLVEVAAAVCNDLTEAERIRLFLNVKQHLSEENIWFGHGLMCTRQLRLVGIELSPDGSHRETFYFKTRSVISLSV